jgi:hypothetical protein
MYVHELKPKVKIGLNRYGVIETQNGTFRHGDRSIYITLPTRRQDTGDFGGCYWGWLGVLLGIITGNCIRYFYWLKWLISGSNYVLIKFSL